jgi:hypothetical protein
MTGTIQITQPTTALFSRKGIEPQDTLSRVKESGAHVRQTGWEWTVQPPAEFLEVLSEEGNEAAAEAFISVAKDLDNRLASLADQEAQGDLSLQSSFARTTETETRLVGDQWQRRAPHSRLGRCLPGLGRTTHQSRQVLQA